MFVAKGSDPPKSEADSQVWTHGLLILLTYFLGLDLHVVLLLVRGVAHHGHAQLLLAAGQEGRSTGVAPAWPGSTRRRRDAAAPTATALPTIQLPLLPA